MSGRTGATDALDATDAVDAPAVPPGKVGTAVAVAATDAAWNSRRRLKEVDMAAPDQGRVKPAIRSTFAWYDPHQRT
jgi:hypothetical protein